MTDQAVEQSEVAGRLWEDPDPEEFAAFVSRLELGRIQVAKIVANRVAEGEAAETNFETRIGFLADDDAIHWRFDCSATILGAEDETLGVVEVGVIVTAEYSGQPTPTPEIMAKFGETSAGFMATPFLREAIASTAQRIGLPNVLLPMVRLTD